MRNASLHSPMTPRPVQHGGGSECGRRIHLRQQTIANGWTLRTDVDRDAGALDQCDEASDGETVRTPIWSRALVPAAPAISFPSSRKVTPCHHLPRIIKPEQVGTDRRRPGLPPAHLLRSRESWSRGDQLTKLSVRHAGGSTQLNSAEAEC